MHERIQPLYQPIWSMEIALILFSIAGFLWGATTTCWLLAIPLLGFGMMKISWLGHSWLHSRNKILYTLGK
jgi:hypothetical protein